MRKRYKILGAVAIVMFMSGCAQTEKKKQQPLPKQQSPATHAQQKDTEEKTSPTHPKGYIQTLSDVNKKARADIHTAVNGRDAKISDMMKDLDLQ